GASTTTATVTIRDGSAQPVVGETVAIAASGGQAVGAVTDHGDGTYTATITATARAESATIRASAGALSAQRALTQRHGPAARAVLALAPATLVADGSSTTDATVTVTDAHGNAVPGETVTLESDGGQQLGAVSDQGDGSYTATITATTRSGSATITARSGSLSATATLTQTPGPATQLTLALDPSTLVANGSSTTTATVTVRDLNDNPVPGETVTVGSDGEQQVGAVTDNDDGSYTATIAATTSVGSATIAAAAGALSDSATLTQVAGEAAQVEVALDPATIVADGEATTVATATVEDAHGNAVSGDALTFAADGGQQLGAVTDHGDGTYSATVTATTRAGGAAIEATDGSVDPAVRGSATLTQTPGAAAQIALTLSPAELLADGSARTTATVLVSDAHGNRPAADAGEVVLASDGGQAIAPVSDHGDGSHTAEITATTTAGSSTISATAGTLRASAQLTQTALPVPPAPPTPPGGGGDDGGRGTPPGGAGGGTPPPGNGGGGSGGTPGGGDGGRSAPANGVTIAALRISAGGRASARLALPAGGRIELRATATAGGRSIVVARVSRRVTRGATVRLTAKPTARGIRWLQQQRRQAAQRGKRRPLTVTVVVTYRPAGGRAQTVRMSGVRIGGRAVRPAAGRSGVTQPGR
ncbi:MAG TPA: invasin domain 3-containing protein, partial [Conexibacter sp.]|nr:invasin domain 3-containing protein [Conexibacter sp.]